MSTFRTRRVRAILVKELREYRHNSTIISATAILPMIFLIQPLVAVFAVPSSAAGGLRQEHTLLYLLGVPVLVPAALAAYAVVGERLQGTLEPVLTTPIRRDELLLGKASAAFFPAVVVAYAVFAIFVGVVEAFARPDVASAFIKAPELLAQLVFTPLLAAWSIWLGIAVSTRSADPRNASQISILASLPTVAVIALVAFGVLPATRTAALIAAAALVVLDVLGWRLASAAFDRERLIQHAG